MMALKNIQSDNERHIIFFGSKYQTNNSSFNALIKKQMFAKCSFWDE